MSPRWHARGFPEAVRDGHLGHRQRRPPPAPGPWPAIIGLPEDARPRLPFGQCDRGGRL